ncbi:arylesterase [Agrilutibacter solisilvae]|nr:arylesterase [Lysobacter solisilvae]
MNSLLPAAAAGRMLRAARLLAAFMLVLPALGQAAPIPATVQPQAPPTVLVFGDSLSAAYNLEAAQGWVALTEQRIAQAHPGWRVVNASISGETTAGGASRIVAEVARVRPSVVIIELGANDGLRGLPLPDTRRNLARMIGAAQGVGAKVLLVGMRLPPNYGAAYTRGFERNFHELAALFETAFVPFLLEPIARDRSRFQSDNLHPTAQAQPALRDHVWPVLEELLD